jgi:phospholipid/cholesterol/gamma-HCH transport system ATP-binding protein
MSNHAIDIKSLKKSFGKHVVLDDVNLSIKKGSSLVILGGSGTGKSVLIKTIVGLIKPDSGTIIMNDTDVTNIPDKLRFDILRECGFLFQGGALFDSLSVKDNITFFASRIYNLSKDEKKDLAIKKLLSVGLSERVLDLYPSSLSGGMQKRVALARAICTNPKIIFFDEPTTGLDPIMSNVINELIINARQELDATTVTITHDIISARAIATDIAFMYGGKIMWQGDPKEIDDRSNEYLYQFVHGLTKGPITV